MRKRILTILLLFSIAISSSGQGLGEFFMNTALRQQSTVYDSVLSICDDADIDYIIHHRYSNDPLTSDCYSPRLRNLQDRTYDQLGYYSPAGFVNGHNLRWSKMSNETSLLEPALYRNNTYQPIIDSIFAYADVEYRYSNDVYFTFNIELFGIDNATVQTVITEDVYVEDLLYKNIERTMVPSTDGLLYTNGDTLSFIVEWNHQWVVDSCNVFVIIEDGNYNVLGYQKFSLTQMLDNATLSIDETLSSTVSVYPIPMKDVLHINGIDYGKQLQLFNSSGQLVFSTIVDSNKINVSSIKRGVYFLRVDNHIQRVVKY